MFAVLATAVVVGGPAGAVTSEPAERQREIDPERSRHLRAQVGEMSGRQARLLAELQVSRRTRRRLDAKVADLDAAIAAAEQDVVTVGTELAAAVAAQLANREALAAAKAQLQGSRRTSGNRPCRPTSTWGPPRRSATCWSG